MKLTSKNFCFSYFSKMMNGFNSFCNKEGNCGPRTNDNCFTHDPSKYSLSQFLAKFPTFTFFFGENETYPYELRGEDYLYEQYPGSHKYCIGIDVFG